MNIVGILQVRSASTRCPGKATADINGLTLTEHVHRRLKAVGSLDQVIVSTSLTSYPVIDLCKEKGWKYWAGSESDLLSRHLGAAMTYDADVVLRITGDCLFIDPAILDRAVGTFSAAGRSADALISWHRGNRTISEGLDFEIVKVDTMVKLANDPNCPREDWLTFLDQSARYRVMGWAFPERRGHDLHLSIDTEDDLERARDMLKVMGNDTWGYEHTLVAERMTRP